MDQPQKKKYIEKVAAEPTKTGANKQYQAKMTDYIPKLKKKTEAAQEMKPEIKEEKNISTRVINVKVKFLRQNGYKSLQEWLQNPNHVYIGRNMAQYVPGAVGSKWANPFKVDDHGREACIEQYRQYINSKPELKNSLVELKGKVLGCWCAPQGCHGDVLAELADNIKQ